MTDEEIIKYIDDLTGYNWALNFGSLSIRLSLNENIINIKSLLSENEIEFKNITGGFIRIDISDVKISLRNKKINQILN